MSEEVGPSWQELAKMLTAVMGGARYDDQDRGLRAWAEGYGLVERETQTKPCRTCGKPQHDFTYHRVTPAGRLLVAALFETQVPA